MCAEATGWVWRHSEYEGKTLIVALAIADVVNDAHGYQFWMAISGLQKKTRIKSSTTIHTALNQMKVDGVLEIVEAGVNTRKPVCYRWLAGVDPAEGGSARPPKKTPPKPRTTPTIGHVPESTTPIVGHVEDPTTPMVGHDMANGWPSTWPMIGHNTEVVTEVDTEVPLKIFPVQSLDEEFEIWWKLYPRKIEKPKARKSYTTRRVNAKAPAEDLLKSVRNYAKATQGSDPTYIKYPASFLNKHWAEWLDGPPDEWKTSGAKKPSLAQPLPEFEEGYRRLSPEEADPRRGTT